ncbi:competence protein ComEC [Planctomycetales bacterium]|nr:competence protein ComEC [Planctomycetales bacterium]GHT35548.1 competence protein ComEC [Planctomycetales bacterium]
MSFASVSKNNSFSDFPLSPVFAAAVSGIVADRFILGNFQNCALPFWILTVFLSFAAYVFSRRKKIYLHSALFVLSTVFAVFGLHHHLHWYRFAADDIGFFAGKIASPAALQGTVIETLRTLPPPEPDPGRVFDIQERTLFTLRAEKFRRGNDWISVSGNVAVSINGNKTGLRIGDKVSIFGKLSRPLPAQNPGDIDYTAVLRNHRILCSIRINSPDAVVLIPPEPKTLTRFFTAGYWITGTLHFLETIRLAARHNLEKVMNAQTVPFAEAMLLGFRENVDEDTVQSLIETGTMHILSISGLHIALASLTLALLLNVFSVPKKIIAGILIIIVLIYFFLTDVRPPALRATVLVCTVSVAVLSGRRASGINSLCTTALFVLLTNPSELFQFGTQLSFIATGTFLWAPSVEAFHRFFFSSKKKLETVSETKSSIISEILRRSLSALAALVLISTIVWLITVPLLLEKIHLFTPVSIIVNPLLGLPMTASLLSGFAVMFFGSVPVIGTISGVCADYSFLLLFNGIEFFRHSGGHYYLYAPPVWWNIVFYTVFCIFTFLPLKRPKFKTIAVLLLFWSAAGITAGYICNFDRWYNDRLTVSVCSAGHGCCTLLTMPDKKTVIYDAGCISSPKRAADVLSNALWRQGTTKIDTVIISHPDKDHYNGLSKIAERFYIGKVLVPPSMFSYKDPALEKLQQTLKRYDIPVYKISAGSDLAGSGLSDATIFHPPSAEITEDSVNASSVVLRLEHRNTGILLPGDLDCRTTPEFLTQKPVHSEIMMVPHHGGSSRQLTFLLNWAAPEILIVSDGTFTHRNPVLSAYCGTKPVLFRSTFESGYIEISIDKNGIKVFP